MGREENVKVFRDTENLCKTNLELVKAIKNFTGKQKLYLENNGSNAQEECL